VNCPTVALCVAVDASGAIAYTTTPLSGGWTGPVTIDSGHQLTAVSCPIATLCFAVDNHGSLFASTAPTSSAWTPGTIDGVVRRRRRRRRRALIDDPGHGLVVGRPGDR
jgi:hypothetical protein